MIHIWLHATAWARSSSQNCLSAGWSSRLIFAEHSTQNPFLLFAGEHWTYVLISAFSWLILQYYYTFAAQVLAMTRFTVTEMLLSCATGRTSVDKLTDKMCWTIVSLFFFSDCTADSNLVYTQRLSQTHTHRHIAHPDAGVSQAVTHKDQTAPPSSEPSLWRSNMLLLNTDDI